MAHGPIPTGHQKKKPARTGSPGGLAPDHAATTQKLADSTNAVALVNAYATALQHVSITEMSGQHAWFKPFMASLVIAQSHGENWIKTLGPQAFSQVPQSIIDYRNTFTEATNNILTIVRNLSGPPTPKQQSDIIALIDAVLSQLTASQTTLSTVQTALQQFASDINSDYTALVKGQNNANKEVITDQNQLQIIQSKINEIHAKISADSKKALASEIGLGIAIFVTIAAIAMAVATDGATAPLIVGAVGLIGVGTAIAGTVIFSKAVKQDYDDLFAEQQKFTDEQAQVAALQSVTNSINALVQANSAAATAMAAILDTWAVLIAKMQTVVDDLKQAEAPDLPAIIEGLDLETAQTAWNQLVSFAQGMQASAENIPVNVVTPPKVPRAA